MMKNSGNSKSKVLSIVATVMIPLVLIALAVSVVLYILNFDIPRAGSLTVILSLVSAFMAVAGVIFAVISAVTAPDTDKENKK
ncbi:MAG: hypothetical protein ACI4RM_05650 [Ruminococcus sp.]